MVTGLNNKLDSCDRKKPTILMVAMTTGTPVKIGSALPTSITGQTSPLANTCFTRITIYGYSALSATGAPTNNAASLFVGWLDALNQAGNGATKPGMLDTIIAGANKVYGGLTGESFDLNLLYVGGTTNDFACILLEQ